jgi:cytochrome c553
MKLYLKPLLASLFLGSFAIAAQAENLPPKPGKVVICAACHGEDGNSASPAFPKLAGQYKNYIEHSLHAYKTGTRKNALMSAQAVGLSDSDIEELATWFSAQKPVLYTPSPDGK